MNCSVDDCTRQVGTKGARGLCPLHYGRLLRIGSTELPTRETMGDRTCSADGCELPARKLGLCAAHYTHKRRHGDANAPQVHRWATDRACAACGATDWPPNGRRRFCSGACQARWSYHGGASATQRCCDRCGMLVDLTVRSTKSGRIKRSDTKLCDLCYGAHYTRHKTSPAVLARRDGTDCGICGDPVDMSLRKPDLFRASVDHIVPWAKGGTHDPENLQLAHLWCNQAKSDRSDFSLASRLGRQNGGQ